jgi:transcriptional regulator with XRE-family HTH domain
MNRTPKKGRRPKRPKIASGVRKEVRIGTRLKHARMVRGLTLKEVADAAGCSESFVSKLENDNASPSFAMLHRLTGILGANVAVLFAASAEVGGLISKAGNRPIILTDSLRVGKGIKLERLIPYSNDYLLQGNINHIDAGEVTAISCILARKSVMFSKVKLS